MGIAVILLSTFCYAFARYVLFGDVAPTQILFLLNKALAFGSAVFLLSAGLARGRSQAGHEQAFLLCTLNHVLLSALFLRPAYFPHLFVAEQLSLRAGLMVLLGLIGLTLVLCYGRVDRRLGPHLLVAISVSLAAHLVLRGGGGWLAPADWHGHLPPISLLSCLLAGAAALTYLRAIWRQPASPPVRSAKDSVDASN